MSPVHDWFKHVLTIADRGRSNLWLILPVIAQCEANKSFVLDQLALLFQSASQETSSDYSSVAWFQVHWIHKGLALQDSSITVHVAANFDELLIVSDSLIINLNHTLNATRLTSEFWNVLKVHQLHAVAPKRHILCQLFASGTSWHTCLGYLGALGLRSFDPCSPCIHCCSILAKERTRPRR